MCGKKGRRWKGGERRLGVDHIIYGQGARDMGGSVSLSLCLCVFSLSAYTVKDCGGIGRGLAGGHIRWRTVRAFMCPICMWSVRVYSVLVPTGSLLLFPFLVCCLIMPKNHPVCRMVFVCDVVCGCDVDVILARPYVRIRLGCILCRRRRERVY